MFRLSLKQKRHWLQNWKAGRETYEKTNFCHKQKYDLFLLGSAWCRHQHLHCRTNVLIYHGPDPRYWTGTWVSYELVHIQNDIFIPPWFPYNFIGIWTISMVRFWSIASSWLHQINSISVIVVIYFRVIDTLRMWLVRVLWSCIFFWGMVSGGGELKMPAKAKAKQSTAGPGQVSISASVKIILIFQEKLLAAKKTICEAINTTNMWWPQRKQTLSPVVTRGWLSCQRNFAVDFTISQYL